MRYISYIFFFNDFSISTYIITLVPFLSDNSKDAERVKRLNWKSKRSTTRMPSKSLHLTSKVLHVLSKPVHVTKYAMLAFSNPDIVISFCDTDTMITTNYSAAIIDTHNRMLKQWRVNNSVNKPSHQTSDIFTKLVYCRPHLFFNLPSPASHLLHVLSSFCT